MNVQEIARGFINSTKAALGIADANVEAEALRRYSICLECPKISKLKTRCKACGCKLDWKTRSNELCPTSKW